MLTALHPSLRERSWFPGLSEARLRTAEEEEVQAECFSRLGLTRWGDWPVSGRLGFLRGSVSCNRGAEERLGPALRRRVFVFWEHDS